MTPADHEAAPEAPPPGPGALFAAFLGVGLVGFGGVLPWLRRMVVDERRWLTPAGFTDMLAFCQILPGPNVVNFSVCFGGRAAGWRGALAALAGLLGGPMLLVIGLGALYQRFAAHPVVSGATGGLAASACGLVLATALKIATPLRGRPLGLLVAAMAFAAVAVLRLPLLPTVLVLAPLSVAVHARAGTGRPPS